jgi:Ca2+-binding EF-hand superfamily protein
MVAMQIKQMQARLAEHAAKMIKRADTDADGMLSAAEMAARPGPEMMFDKIDANHDGAVTQDEVDAMQAHMQQKHGKGHGKHGHGKHHKHGN